MLISLYVIYENYRNSQYIKPIWFGIKKAKQVATAERIPLFHSTVSDIELFFLKKEDTIIAVVVGQTVTIGDNDYFEISRIWVGNNFREKGYATALYGALVTKLKLHLLSGEEQSPIVKRIWKNVDRVMDMDTNDIQNRDTIDDSDLYIDGSGTSSASKRYRLIWEDINRIGDIIYSLEQNLIVGDNLIVTHADNTGKYE